MEAGVIRVAIDRGYLLEQAAEVHRYVEAGRKKGRLALIVGQPTRAG